MKKITNIILLVEYQENIERIVKIGNSVASVMKEYEVCKEKNANKKRVRVIISEEKYLSFRQGQILKRKTIERSGYTTARHPKTFEFMDTNFKFASVREELHEQQTLKKLREQFQERQSKRSNTKPPTPLP